LSKHLYCNGNYLLAPQRCFDKLRRTFCFYSFSLFFPPILLKPNLPEPQAASKCRVKRSFRPAALSSRKNLLPVASSQQLAQLDRLERQITTLVAAYQELREELADATTTIQQLKADVREKDRQLKERQNQENIVKLVHTIAGEPTHANELKLRLNEYIRELDKCLAYLRD
jgi:septal ring factor EnvC (AmiA/AmiB activator)